MKRIVIVIFLFFLLIVNVNAEKIQFDVEKIIDGIYYEKDNGAMKYYRYVSKIIDTKSKQLAYCVQPFVNLTGSDNYTEYDSFDKIFNFTEKEWERIRLYSYYGYGYKNHLEEKWITITQLSLWRDIYPQYRFDWIDNFTNKKIIYPYNKEIKELNRLILTHNTMPNYKDGYEMGINSKLELFDSNEVLENFEVMSSDFNYKVENNKLTIISGEEKEGTIEFIKAKNIYPNTSLFYYDKASQAVVKRGNIEEKRFIINISVKQGKININKVDGDNNTNTPQGEASLDGAIYEIRNDRNEIVDEKTIENNYLTFDNLPWGKYYIQEKKSGEGYYVDKNTYEVVIDKDNLEQEIKLSNNVIKSRVNIYKYFGSKDDYINNKMKEEKDVFFEIIDNNNTIINKVITNNSGHAEILLPYGKYIIRQVNTISGYNKIDDYLLIINEENAVNQDLIFYDLKIEVPNAGIYY